MNLKREELSRALAYYESRHTTPGCKFTHMFGVPLLLLSLPVFLFNRRIGAAMFGLGAILQLAGHFFFERNRPILAENPTSLLNYTSAIFFVAREWVSAFKRCAEISMTESRKEVG